VSKFTDTLADRLLRKNAQKLDLEQYSKEWGRPQSLEQEVQEVRRLIEYWESRGGSTYELNEVLQALQNDLRAQQELMADEPTQPGIPAVKMTASRLQRVASLHDIPSDLTSLGAGFYRQGHRIWELRAAEDDEGGYVLTRKSEECAVDLRDQTYSESPQTVTAFLRHTAQVGHDCACDKGMENASVSLDSMPGFDTRDLAHAETLILPTEMSLDEAILHGLGKARDVFPAACQVDDDDDDLLFRNEMPNAANMEEADFVIFINATMQLQGMAFDDMWGKTVSPTRDFAPVLMGGDEMKPDSRTVYEVEGKHTLSQENDALYGVPSPTTPFPQAKHDDWYVNDRIRLRPLAGGETVFVTTTEFRNNFAPVQDSTQSNGKSDVDEVPEMPGEPSYRPSWDEDTYGGRAPQERAHETRNDTPRPRFDKTRMTLPEDSLLTTDDLKGR